MRKHNILHINSRLRSIFSFCVFLLFIGIWGSIDAQVTVNGPCMIGELTFDFNNVMSPDGSGRNVFTNDSAQAHIKYNPSMTRWEIISYGPEAFVYYATGTNTFAPNPPSSTIEDYVNQIIGEGCLDENNAMVSGDTQDMMGEDPCIPLGGDSDSDGICNANDICPGHDDNIDTDGDGIPDGCDSDPNMANNSVIVTSLCLSSDPIEFIPEGKDGSGRNYYTNELTQLEIRFNIAMDQWEVKALAPGTTVFYINTFASWPNPPDDMTSPWMSVTTVCDTTPATVDGDGTQDMLVIPTLSQWGIIIMGLLLILIGVLYEKKRISTKNILNT